MRLPCIGGLSDANSRRRKPTDVKCGISLERAAIEPLPRAAAGAHHGIGSPGCAGITMERTTASTAGEAGILSGSGALTIREWPESERPREKLLARGAHALSDAELLALLLGSGIPGCSAVAMARSLLKDFGCLRDLLNARLARWRRKGIGAARYAAVQAAVELAKRHLREQMR